MRTRFVIIFLLSAFGLHLLWEILQCGLLYQQESYPMTVAGILRVTAADVGLSALIYAAVAAGRRDVPWERWPRGSTLLLVAVLGMAVAVVIETHALATGRWAYSDRMPLLPGLDVGLAPVLQLGLIPALAALIGARASVR